MEKHFILENVTEDKRIGVVISSEEKDGELVVKWQPSQQGLKDLVSLNIISPEDAERLNKQ